MLKRMIFCNMFDIIDLGSTVANIGRRDRIRDTRCARACIFFRRSCSSTCAGILFHLAPAPQPVRLLGHRLHSELVRHARLDRAAANSAAADANLFRGLRAYFCAREAKAKEEAEKKVKDGSIYLPRTQTTGEPPHQPLRRPGRRL